jgi:hypothetical protein
VITVFIGWRVFFIWKVGKGRCLFARLLGTVVC